MENDDDKLFTDKQWRQFTVKRIYDILLDHFINHFIY